jgi:hypothetical protein
MKAAMPTCHRLFLISRLVFRRWCWGPFVSSLPTGLSNWLTGILPHNAARLPKKPAGKFSAGLRGSCSIAGDFYLIL